MKVKWNKIDELESIIKGIQFINEINNQNECFYFDIQNDSETGTHKSIKTSYSLNNNLYPYIVVNIGSGVSILLGTLK